MGHCFQDLGFEPRRLQPAPLHWGTGAGVRIECFLPKMAHLSSLGPQPSTPRNLGFESFPRQKDLAHDRGDIFASFRTCQFQLIPQETSPRSRIGGPLLRAIIPNVKTPALTTPMPAATRQPNPPWASSRSPHMPPQTPQPQTQRYPDPKPTITSEHATPGSPTA